MRTKWILEIFFHIHIHIVRRSARFPRMKLCYPFKINLLASTKGNNHKNCDFITIDGTDVYRASIVQRAGYESRVEQLSKSSNKWRRNSNKQWGWFIPLIEFSFYFHSSTDKWTVVKVWGYGYWQSMVQYHRRKMYQSSISMISCSWERTRQSSSSLMRISEWVVPVLSVPTFDLRFFFLLDDCVVAAVVSTFALLTDATSEDSRRRFDLDFAVDVDDTRLSSIEL